MAEENVLRRLWNWLNGKKTVIAAAYWGIAIPAIPILFPEGAPPEAEKAIAIIGLVLTYLGLTHKTIKSATKKGDN